MLIQGGRVRGESELAAYAALKPEYQKIVDVVDLFPRGIQARRIAKLTHPRSWEVDEYDITSEQVKSIRVKLAALEKKGFVTIERTAEYGNIYRPVNSSYDKHLWTTEYADKMWTQRQDYETSFTEADRLAVAAYSMTLGAWRNTIVEDAHSDPAGPHDGEMFAANVSTFRMFRDFLMAGDRSEEAWDRLGERLTNPLRSVAGKSLSDLIPRQYYERWVAEATSAVEYFAELTQRDDHDVEWFIAVYSCWGSIHSDWFGMPDWPRVVEYFVEKPFCGPWPLEHFEGRDESAFPTLIERARRPRELPVGAEELRAGLLNGPDAMDPEVLVWCINDGIGFIESALRTQ
ncbi:MAG: hypothetical protein JWN03_2839 [Nocardia sp.]|nr:hypothetical protein [Nocardia sp.]